MPVEETVQRVLCDRHRLLIVDDEPMVSDLFEMILEEAFPDCTVEVAANGAVALERFAQRHHAVLLMDLHMPVMDGVEAFNRLRESCEQQNWEMPSVIFCSGYAPGARLTQAMEADARHGFLPKPVSAIDIERAIRARLDRKDGGA